jgi:hypothetical protein
MNIGEDEEKEKQRQRQKQELSQEPRRQNSEGTLTFSDFWAVYDRLEKLDSGTNIVNHKKLHEALIASGKFFAGDAAQIISDMVKAGKLELVSYHSYRRK